MSNRSLITMLMHISLVSHSIQQIRKDLKGLVDSGKTLAIWGGTGKCASFMHHYNITSKDVSTVVDSDERKWGTYVPGVGQEIRKPSDLLVECVDILIIPTQWRAKDILIEADSINLSFEQVLIEHNGKLIDFRKDEHPYAKDD